LDRILKEHQRQITGPAIASTCARAISARCCPPSARISDRRGLELSLEDTLGLSIGHGLKEELSKPPCYSKIENIAREKKRNASENPRSSFVKTCEASHNGASGQLKLS